MVLFGTYDVIDTCNISPKKHIERSDKDATYRICAIPGKLALFQ